MNEARESSGGPMRLGVLISGGGTTMVNLAERIAAGTLDAEIALVICSNRKAKGIARAEALGLRVEIVSRKDFEGTEGFSARCFELLDGAGAELVVLAGFLSLLRIPEGYAGRVMNIHPALLPKYGGQGMYGHHVHEAVIAAGETESGCTVHFADNEYDNGPIVLQRRVPVLEGDSADDLAARVMEAEREAYPEAIERFIRGEIGSG